MSEETTPTSEQTISRDGSMTPDRAKIQVANSIMQSIFQLKNCTNDYEKDFILRGITLNFEYIGRMEFDKLQKDFEKRKAESEASAAAPATPDSSTDSAI